MLFRSGAADLSQANPQQLMDYVSKQTNLAEVLETASPETWQQDYQKAIAFDPGAPPQWNPAYVTTALLLAGPILQAQAQIFKSASQKAQQGMAPNPTQGMNTEMDSPMPPPQPARPYGGQIRQDWDPSIGNIEDQLRAAQAAEQQQGLNSNPSATPLNDQYINYLVSQMKNNPNQANQIGQILSNNDRLKQYSSGSNPTPTPYQFNQSGGTPGIGNLPSPTSNQAPMASGLLGGLQQSPQQPPQLKPKPGYQSITDQSGSQAYQKIPTYDSQGNPETNKLAADSAGRFAQYKTASDTLGKAKAMLYSPDGSVNRSVLATSSVGKGIPLTKGREYKSIIGRSIDAAVRAATGATINEAEWPMYESMYMPKLGDSDQQVSEKLSALENFVNSAKSGIDPNGTIEAQTNRRLRSMQSNPTNALEQEAVRRGYRKVNGQWVKS